MIRLIRFVGLMMMGAGGLVLLVWAIKPLRFIWPWIRELPWPIQLGIAIAALGLLLLTGSIIWERFESAEYDKSLLDDE
jgi:hypothetical protein